MATADSTTHRPTDASSKRTSMWLDYFQRKVTTPEKALEAVKSGDRVYIHPGCAEPESLVQAMVARKDELTDVEVVHILTLGSADYVGPGMEGHFRHRCLFTGPNVRKAVNEGRADYVPIFLGEIHRLFTDGTLPIDVALIQVSPPDEHGFCSYGVGVDITKPAAENAKIVIAEVNRQTPRTLGDSFIHLHKIDHIVMVDRPMLELKPVTMTEVHSKIGRFVADLIDDGSTLQMGIGGIPDAVLHHLQDKQDLGVHTEMFSDGVIDLVRKGVINNEKKTLHPGKIISAFVLGTRDLYDFIDNNPICEFHPDSYCNDPYIIAQNDNMVAINSALQVDLTGQVCSDSIGYSIYSGFGGQVDFIRGAARSRGGKPIIALPSTAKNDTLSRIVVHLDEGAGVVTSRADVHYVVTEYGVAYLFGRSIRERAKALIGIAHPKFRDELTEQARKLKYL
ncbi:MAG: acetyl-CoA hydrolase/transferase C-terminal domain-containing protein [Candidatus Zixiibacteriota bacterium]